MRSPFASSSLKKELYVHLQAGVKENNHTATCLVFSGGSPCYYQHSKANTKTRHPGKVRTKKASRWVMVVRLQLCQLLYRKIQKARIWEHKTQFWFKKRKGFDNSRTEVLFPSFWDSDGWLLFLCLHAASLRHNRGWWGLAAAYWDFKRLWRVKQARIITLGRARRFKRPS